MATQVFHLGILQMAPNALGRVQLWGIGGKLLQVDAFGSTICQEVLDGLASMSGQAIPQDQQLARDVTQEMFEKAHNIGTSEGVVLDHHIQLSFRCDRSDGRQVIAAQVRAQDWGLTSGCIGAHQRWQERKTALIDPHQGAAFLYCLFLSVGHASSTHCWIASSSRWAARLAGFCKLNPSALKIRPTCPGEYVTPNSRRMTAATRLRVHTSPRKPYACAPFSNKAGILLFCAWLNRDLAPGAGRRLSASFPPPSRARFIHWLTAPGVTPSASAISFCFQPCCLSSHARRRRYSRTSLVSSVSFMGLFYPVSPRKFKNLCSRQ
jgi:hypothetical protein